MISLGHKTELLGRITTFGRLGLGHSKPNLLELIIKRDKIHWLLIIFYSFIAPLPLYGILTKWHIIPRLIFVILYAILMFFALGEKREYIFNKDIKRLRQFKSYWGMYLKKEMYFFSQVESILLIRQIRRIYNKRLEIIKPKPYWILVLTLKNNNLNLEVSTDKEFKQLHNIAEHLSNILDKPIYIQNQVKKSPTIKGLKYEDKEIYQN